MQHTAVRCCVSERDGDLCVFREGMVRHACAGTGEYLSMGRGGRPVGCGSDRVGSIHYLPSGPYERVCMACSGDCRTTLGAC